MSKLRIVDIKHVPRWKFWKSDNLEVVLDNEQGNRKTITVHALYPISMPLLKQNIIDKYHTGDQFWSLHQKQKNIPKDAQKLIGEILDFNAEAEG